MIATTILSMALTPPPLIPDKPTGWQEEHERVMRSIDRTIKKIDDTLKRSEDTDRLAEEAIQRADELRRQSGLPPLRRLKPTDEEVRKWGLPPLPKPVEKK